MSDKLNPKSLQQARKSRKLSKREVADFTKISENRLSDFEEGVRQPTFKQLEQLSDLYNVELYIFFLSNMPQIEATLPDFRKTSPREADISPKGLARLWQVERRANFSNEVFIALGKKAPQTETFSRLTNSATPQPEELRAAFDLWRNTRDRSLKFTGSAESVFERQLRLFLEVRACQTVFNSAPVEDYLGFYKSFSDKNKTIFVNRDIKNEKRKLFTLSHEVSHFLLEKEGISNPFIAKNSVEKECNSFAASFLAPEKEVFDIIARASSAILKDITRLVNFVSKDTLLSRQAAALRLEELDVITRRQLSEVFSHLNKLSRVVEPTSEHKPNLAMGRKAAIGKKLSEVGVLAAYTAKLGLQHKLIDAVDIERGLGISESLQADVLDLAARRFEASAS